MNLGEATVVLRKRSSLEVLDLSLRFVRALQPKKFLLLSLFVLGPSGIGLVLLKQLLHLPWWTVWMAALLGARLLEVPFTLLASDLLFSRRVSLAQVLRNTLKRLPGFCLTFLLYTLVLALSFLLVLGPLFVSAHHFFLGEVSLLEMAGPRRALARSKQLISGRSGVGLEGVFLRLTIMAAFVVMCEILGEALLVHGLSLELPHDTLFEDGGSWFAVAGFLASLPYAACFRFLSYINERTRIDGWDVQVAFLRLASEENKSVRRTREPHAKVA